jgi:hypothetical protein
MLLNIIRRRLLAFTVEVRSGIKAGTAERRTIFDIISVAVIQGRYLGYFIHISITTPVVSALKNYYR